MSQSDLLPCPFCGDDGDKSIVEYVAPQNGDTWKQAKCRGCGATASLAAWNTRARLAQPEATTPLNELVAEYEKDPTMKRALDNARAPYKGGWDYASRALQRVQPEAQEPGERTICAKCGLPGIQVPKCRCGSKKWKYIWGKPDQPEATEQRSAGSESDAATSAKCTDAEAVAGGAARQAGSIPAHSAIVQPEAAEPLVDLPYELDVNILADEVQSCTSRQIIEGHVYKQVPLRMANAIYAALRAVAAPVAAQPTERGIGTSDDIRRGAERIRQQVAEWKGAAQPDALAEELDALWNRKLDTVEIRWELAERIITSLRERGSK